MSLEEVMIHGTLKSDGTLELDQKPNLAPGRVTVVVRQEQKPSQPLKENWFQYLQRIRAKREAVHYPFIDEAATNAHIEWLRETDRIDDLLRGAQQQGEPGRT